MRRYYERRKTKAQERRHTQQVELVAETRRFIASKMSNLRAHLQGCRVFETQEDLLNSTLAYSSVLLAKLRKLDRKRLSDSIPPEHARQLIQSVRAASGEVAIMREELRAKRGLSKFIEAQYAHRMGLVARTPHGIS
jgi:hypothetical protein